jgi:hypothetical protein
MWLLGAMPLFPPLCAMTGRRETSIVTGLTSRLVWKMPTCNWPSSFFINIAVC